MQTIRLELPKRHNAQHQIVRDAVRFNIVNCGRRWGKSLLGQERLVRPALAGHPVAWFAPTYRLLGQAWRDVNRTLRGVITERSVQEHRLALATGGVIEMWTLTDEDAGRSRKYKRVIIDEAALASKLMNAWTGAIRPTLTDLKGDAYFLSTPKGHNAFWQMYQWGMDSGRPDWRAWTFPTASNPFIDKSEIEAARRGLPERVFAQEYLAQFLDDAGGVFRRVIEAATLDEQPPMADHQYVMGVDWGKMADFTVVTVGDLATNQIVKMDRFNQINYQFQAERLKVLAGQYQPTVILAESNSMGEPIIDRLQADGLPVRGFTTTNTTKAQIIENLSLAFERGAIEIVNDPVLIGELQAFEMARLPSGKTRYAAPEGMHDDCVMSLALCYSAMHDMPTESDLLDIVKAW